MLCLRIPYYKLYKKGLFSYVLTLKYMCNFGMNFKKLNRKAKNKNKILWLFVSYAHLVLCFPTYLFT
jgi:hypothetical protein